jgi:hypothetical protein
VPKSKIRKTPPDINVFAARLTRGISHMLDPNCPGRVHREVREPGEHLAELMPYQDKAEPEIREELADHLQALGIRAAKYAAIFRPSA